jgi:hypothetical protein
LNKIVSTKRTSAIFIAIVLVLGTFALSSQSFNIGVNAQAQPYYGMDRYDDMKSYGMDDSYGPTDYGMDNDRKSYDNSYYKSQYSSYDKHDRDKSKKDSKKSVSINKFNCINTNLNINGNNTGDINVGNKGQGYLGVSSSSGGYGDDDGYSKQGKGFDCVINNNNTNTNIVTVGGDERDPCVECFRQVLNASAFAELEEILRDEGIIVTIPTGPGGPIGTVEIHSLLELCRILENLTDFSALASVVQEVLEAADITLTPEELRELEICIATALGIPLPTPE